nr:hypothetical protein MBKG4397_5290 [Mycoplasmopsis bovis]
MKLKLKPIIITSAITFSATVALAVGLSYVPFGDKKIDQSGTKHFRDEVHGAPGLPNQSDISHLPLATPELHHLGPRVASKHIIKESDKVKYVALGDSISAGFDARLDKDYPGNYDKEKNTITGISFPTYLAKFIQTSNGSKSKLESYTNYASSGTSLEDWTFLLSADEAKIKELEEKQSAKLAYYKRKFGENILEKAKKIKDELKTSNLVTITLSANDFMELAYKKLKDSNFISNIQNIKANPSSAIAQIGAAFQDIFGEMKNRIDKFSAELKKHVTTDNVNFIGYPLPVPYLFVLLDNYLFNNSQSKLIVSQMSINLLNDNIKTQVTKNNFNFINPYNVSFWTKSENMSRLNPVIFDIHPGSYGYKKMAQDVFIKLITSDRHSKALNEQGIDWNDQYIDQDAISFTRQLEFSDQYKAIKQSLTENINNNLFEEDEIYSAFNTIRQKGFEHYKKRVLDNTLVTSIIDGAIDLLLRSQYFKKADPSNKLAKFFTDGNKRNLVNFKSWIDKSEFIPNLLLKSELEFKNTYLKQDNPDQGTRANLMDFANTLKKNLLNEADLITLLVSFFNSDFIQDSKEELKGILEEFAHNMIVQNVDAKQLSEAINKLSSSNGLGKINAYEIVQLIKSVLGSQSVKKSIGELFLNLANNSNAYKKAKTIDELLKLFLTDQGFQKIINDLTSDLLDELSNDNDLNKTFSAFASAVAKANGDIFKDIEEKDLKELFSASAKSLKDLNKEFKIAETFVSSLLTEVSRSGIKNISFSNILSSAWSQLKKNFEGKRLDESLIKIAKAFANAESQNAKNALGKLLGNAFKYAKNSPELINKISNFILDQSSTAAKNISSSDLSEFIKAIFNSNEFEALFSDLAKSLVQINKENWNEITSFADLVRYVFVNFVTGKNQSIGPRANEAMKSLLRNENVKKSTIKILLSTLKGYTSITKGIGDDKLLSLFYDVFGKYDELDRVFKFENIYESLLSYLGTNSGNINLTELSYQLNRKLERAFENKSIEDVILELVKIISKDKFAKNHKETLVKLVENIFAFAKEGKYISTTIADSIFESINKDSLGNFITKDDLVKLIHQLLTDESFKKLMGSVLSTIADADSSTVQNFSNIKDLMDFIVGKIVKSSDYQYVQGVAKLLTQSDAFIKLIQNASKDFFDFSENDIKTLFVALTGSKELNDLTKDFLVKGIFTTKTKWAEISNLDLIIKNWLKESSSANLADNLEKFFVSLVNKDVVAEVFANSSFKAANKYANAFEGIKENEYTSFIKDLFKILPELSNKLFVKKYFVEQLFDELRNEGTKANLQSVFNSYIQKLSASFQSNNWDKNVLDLIKVINSKGLISKHKSMLSKLINNTVSKVFTNEKFGNDLGGQIFNSFKEIKTFANENDFKKLIAKSFNSTNFQNFFKQLTEELLSVAGNELEKATSVKSLMDKAVQSLKSKGALENLAQFAKEFVNFDESQSIFNNLFNSIGNAKEGVKFTPSQIKELINYLADDNDLKELTISLLTEGFFSDKLSINDFNDYDMLLKTWLNKYEVRKSVVKNVKSIIEKAFSKHSIRRTFATLIYKLMENEESLVRFITSKDLIALISDSLQNYGKVNHVLNFNNWFLDGIFEQLAKNGTKIDNKAVEELVVKNLGDKFSSKNWEKSAVDLIKSLASVKIVLNHEDTIGQFVANIFNYAADKKEVGSMIYDQLTTSYKDTINKYIAKDKFNNIIKAIFVKNQKAIASLMKNITLSMKLDIAKYHNSQTIMDVFKIYFDQEEKIYLISKDISVVVDSLLKDKDIQEFIKTALNEQLKQYNIQVDSKENKDFIKAFIDELPTLISNLHLVPKLLNGVSSGLKQYKSATELFTNIISLTLESINFNDFSLIKTVLESDTLNKHSKVLGDNIKAIYKGATSDDKLVSKFIDDFGLTNLLSSKGISDSEAKEVLKLVFKSGDADGALGLLIDGFFKDVSKFKEVNSWPKFISTLISNVDEYKAKEHIKKWMVEIVNNNSTRLFDVIAHLLIEQFNKNGYKIPAHEKSIIAKFIHSLTKSIVGTKEQLTNNNSQNKDVFNDMVNSIFNALKKLNDDDDILDKVAEAAKSGALSFVTEGTSISIAKIFDNIPKFQKLMENVDSKAYADFINVMFKYADPTDDNGLFKAIFHSDKSSGSLKLGARGFLDILKGKVQQLISAFVMPLMKNYVRELEETKEVYRTAQQVKQYVSGYQALWRVYASLAAMLYSNTPRWLFWNATNLTSEGFLRAGFEDAFQKAIEDKNLDKYYNNYSAIGLKWKGKVNHEFWAGVSKLWHGPTSFSISQNYYARDYVLAYIYYQGNNDILFNAGKTMRQVLIEDLVRGYMPVDTS